MNSKHLDVHVSNSFCCPKVSVVIRFHCTSNLWFDSYIRTCTQNFSAVLNFMKFHWTLYSDAGAEMDQLKVCAVAHVYVTYIHVHVKNNPSIHARGAQ